MKVPTAILKQTIYCLIICCFQLYVLVLLSVTMESTIILKIYGIKESVVPT